MPRPHRLLSTLFLAWSVLPTQSVQPVQQVGESVLALRGRPKLDDVVIESKFLSEADAALLLGNTGLLGLRASDKRAQELLAAVTQWYKAHGFLSAWATGLKYDGDTVRIQVAEPSLAEKPVELKYLRRVAETTDANGVVVPPQMVEGKGRTRPGFVAHALGLTPGQPLRTFDMGDLTQHGPFRKVEASWAMSPDNRVRLLLKAEEKPSRVVIPSLTMSRGSLAGDVTLQDRNFLGRGLFLSTTVKQGRHDPVTSGEIKLGNPNLGRPGASTIRVYSTIDTPGPGGIRTVMPTDIMLASRAVKSMVSRDGSPLVEELDLIDEGLQQRLGLEITFKNPWPGLSKAQFQHATRAIVEHLRPTASSSITTGEQLAEVGISLEAPLTQTIPWMLKAGGELVGNRVAQGQRFWRASGDVGLRPLRGEPKPYAWGHAFVADYFILDGQKQRPKWLASWKKKILAHTLEVPEYAQTPLGGRRTLRGHRDGSLGVPGVAYLERMEVSRLLTEAPKKIFPPGMQPRLSAFVDTALFPRRVVRPEASPPEEVALDLPPSPKLRDRVGFAGGVGVGLELWILKLTCSMDFSGNRVWDAGLAQDFEW